MHPLARGVSDGRATVALSLSAGRCTATENHDRRSAVRVVHGDPGGLAMRCAWAQQHHQKEEEEEEEEEEGGDDPMLVVRTPFVTAEGGEPGTLPCTTYTQALAAQVAEALTRHDAAEVLTVAHGPAGSGKSIQVFGAAVAAGEHQSCAQDGGLFTEVLRRIFAATELDPCVAISVVELRPSCDVGDSLQHQQQQRSNTTDTSHGEEDTSVTDAAAMPTEAIDLLGRTTDRSSPTGCFMEDYADIPAARYVRCTAVAEVLTVLHTALRYSLAWQPVGNALAQGSADVFGVPDTRPDAERYRRVSEAGEEELVHQQRCERAEGCHSAWSSEFLRPTAGASSHVLVTLLLRFGSGTTSVWRLWDLAGPTVWRDDGSAASRMAFATHTAISQMALRYRHRDQLQGGWWVADAVPERIEDIVPLHWQSQRQPHIDAGLDKTTAMIEAVIQHSCSSLLWIASLRFDACYDDINEDALEAASSLLAGSDGTNGHVISELRRRRRQENLGAAARVLDMFAVPFSREASPRLVPSECAGTGECAALPTAALTPRTPRLMSPTREPPNRPLTAAVDYLNASLASFAAADNSLTAAHLDASGTSSASPPYAAGASSEAATAAGVLRSTSPVAGSSPWMVFVGKESCQEAQQQYHHHHQQQQQKHWTPPPALSHLSPKRDAVCVPNRSPSGASPLSPPSVTGTEHPESTVKDRSSSSSSISGRRGNLLWDTTADEAGAPSLVPLPEGDDGSEHGSADQHTGSRWREGAARVPSDAPADLASIVRRLLERPLAQLQEFSLRHQQELARQHHRVVARLNGLLSSDAATLEELQRQVRGLVVEEEEAAARRSRVKHDTIPRDSDNSNNNKDSNGGCSRNKRNTRRQGTTPLDVFGPDASLQTSLELELSNCGSSNIGTRPCGCDRLQHRKVPAVTHTRQLIAAERKIRFLEQQLLRLERENNDLRTDLSFARVRGGGGGGAAAAAAPSASSQGLESVFNDILKRCSSLYEKKAAEADQLRGKCDAAMRELQFLRAQKQQYGQEQQQQRLQQRERVAPVEKLPEKAVAYREASGLFTNSTNRLPEDASDRSHRCSISVTTPNNSFVSSPSAHAGDSATMRLHSVLLRATRFATNPNSSTPPTQQQQQDAVNGFVLSIDRGSDFSLPVAEDGDSVFAGVRALREAAGAVRDSALRVVHVARGAVHATPPAPAAAVGASGCGADLVRLGDALATSNACPAVGVSPPDVREALARAEGGVYRAVAELQREAAGLQHAAVEAMSRERQLLSRVLLT